MVSLGAVLVTVSTLAMYMSNTVSAESFAVHHACEGNTLCHIKPANYPQEKIDQLVIKNLPHLHRMKRSAPARLAVARPNTEGNCNATFTMKSPFTVASDLDKRAPYFIVQSHWFHQEIPEVSCSGRNTECFHGLSYKPSYCKAKMVTSDIFIYDHLANKLDNMTIITGVDCVCEV